MRPLAVGLAIGLAIGLAAGLLAARWLPPLAVPQPTAEGVAEATRASDEIRVLRGELEAERELRRELAAEIEATGGGREREVGVEVEAEPSVLAAADGAAAPAPAAEAQPKPAWFARDSLVSLGLSASEVDRIHERWERYTLDKLRIDDEQMRAGEGGGPARFFKLLALERDVREDLGEEGYDAMLFASGTPNRVVIQDVLASSPGGEAGLQPQDRVIRYDDVRVFDLLSLRTATAQGTPGETVWMDLLRDGRSVTVRVPRGPLGVRIEARAETPLLPR